MVKKLVIFLFLTVLTVSLFAVGNRQGAGSSVAAGASKRYGNLPFATGNRTRLSMLIPVGGQPNITSFNYNDNLFTREVTDRTGIQFDFITVPSTDYATRRNLLLASGDYPDVINVGFNFNDMAYWASEGVIVPLDDYHLLDYPMIAKAFNDYPALNTRLRLGDGKAYALPSVDDAIWGTYSFGRGAIHMPWIRDFQQMRFPRTLDELTTYLRWIRDTDVNRNGNPNDEVPLAFVNVQNSTAWFAKAFMPFVYTGSHFGLALVNGRVTEQYKATEYRNALRYMASLYGEGLIKQDSYTMTVDQLRALSLNPEPVLGVLLDSWAMSIIGTTNARWPESFVLPPMNGPSGRHWSSNREPWGIVDARWHVTDKCSDPELVIALYDFLATDEMYLNGSNQRGVSWTDPDRGALGMDGRPALYKRLIQEPQMPLNSLWYIYNATIMYRERRMGEQTEGMDIVNRWLTTGDPTIRDTVLNTPSFLLGGLIHWSQEDAPNAIPDDYFIPLIIFSDADSRREADIRAVLNPYLNQSIAEFVTGVRNINNDAAWNSYIADLDRLGAQERAGIFQRYIR